MVKRQTNQGQYRFECTQCGECCRRPGYVEFTPSDVARVMEFLDIDDITLFETFELVGFEENFAVHVEKGKPCTFLDGDLCRVFDARPEQCRTYPFWPEFLNSIEDWQAEGEFCPGIGKGEVYTKTEINRLIRGDGETKAGAMDENA